MNIYSVPLPSPQVSGSTGTEMKNLALGACSKLTGGYYNSVVVPQLGSC